MNPHQNLIDVHFHLFVWGSRNCRIVRQVVEFSLFVVFHKKRRHHNVRQNTQQIRLEDLLNVARVNRQICQQPSRLYNDLFILLNLQHVNQDERQLFLIH